MTRCACDRADLDDHHPETCWQCFVDADIARYERSVASIAAMRERVAIQFGGAITADNVAPDDPSERPAAEMVSYVRAFNGSLTHDYAQLAA